MPAEVLRALSQIQTGLLDTAWRDEKRKFPDPVVGFILFAWMVKHMALLTGSSD
jgi:hypothetical protein